MELDMMSVPEVAVLLRVSTHTVRGWLRDKKLPRSHAGGRVLISRRSIEQFVQTSPPPRNEGLQGAA